MSKVRERFAAFFDAENETASADEFLRDLGEAGLVVVDRGRVERLLGAIAFVESCHDCINLGYGELQDGDLDPLEKEGGDG